jgi:hypothetical protein
MENEEQKIKIEAEKENLLEDMMEDIKEFQNLYRKIKNFKFKDVSDVTYLEGNIDPIINIIDGAREYLEALQELYKMQELYKKRK